MYKNPGDMRVFFQNVKGLTHTTGCEDYRYFVQAMNSYEVDVFGMAETNSGWQHRHLQEDFRMCMKRQFQYGKAIFGAISREIDPLPVNEHFQAGGTLQAIQGIHTTKLNATTIIDKTGLGRWCGSTIIGKGGQKISLVTCYRSCAGSIQSAPIGSTFAREYEYFRSRGQKAPQPRTQFLIDLTAQIKTLQDEGHSLVLMMDANTTIDKDKKLQDMLDSHDMHDMHQIDPAPSTYIAHPNRRIDYIFACGNLKESINRSGTLSYFEGPQSDHRGLYIDINLHQHFGDDQSTQQLARHPQRDLRSGNPELVGKYIIEMKKYYDEHRMEERMDNLMATHNSLSRSRVRQILIQWDEDQGRAMKHAESALRHSPKQYEWSPKLRNAGVQLRYWKLRLREIQKSENYSVTFARWENQIRQHDETFELPLKETLLTIEAIRHHLNEATQQLRKIQKAASDIRSASYYALLEKYEADEDPTTRSESERKAKIVHRTIQSETSKSMFAKIRRIIKPSELSALTKIEIPRLNTEVLTPPGKVHEVIETNSPESLIWDTIITQKDMEEQLLTFNKIAFRAAAESPCGHGLIHDALTFTSLSKEAEDILKGIVPEEWYGDDQLLKEFLASFRIPESILDMQPISTTISTEDIIKGFRSWKETTTTSPSGRHLGHYKAIIQDDKLLKSLQQFLHITLTRGISIPRWCNAVNVMIEKDPGRPRINRLRIIHLFEADYNFLLKLMWGSRLVKRAVKMNLLNSGQHGSVPGRTTMAPIMLNQLTTDLCRILKTNYVRFDNDASACFDRIVVALGMLAARRCGMPAEAIRTHAESLELMKYTVKTIYGISESSYQGTPFAPLFGTGQGSGASPSVWLSLVVILLNTLDRVTTQRISFKSADGTIEHRRLVDAFVDDTALGFTDYGDQTMEELVEQLEQAAQTWEKLLHYSGGALNLSKCSWYIMFWDWRQGRPILRQINDEDPTVSLTRGTTKTRTTIKRLPLDHPTRLLGVHQTPDGDFLAHILNMKKKADDYAKYLRSPRLTKTDVRVFHRSIYSPAMRYSLPAVAVDEEELDSIQTRIMPTIVNRLGMSSKTPTAIRHGPISMGGLGLLDLRTENGVEMIKYMRNEIHGKTTVGQLIILQLQASQLEAGVQIQLLEKPEVLIPYLTPAWILSVRQFLSNNKMTITVSQVLRKTLRGKFDTHIMETNRLQRYTVQQQTDINRVRIYLQVTTLYDMCETPDTRRIQVWALQGQRPKEFISDRAWPRQHQPSIKQIRLWRTYIASQFLRYDRYWRQIPIDDTVHQDTHSNEDRDQGNREKQGVPYLIKGLPLSQRRLLSHVEQMASDEDIREAFFSDQTLTLATDGGLKDRRGTHGWNIRSSTNEILIEGAGPVDGPHDTANSTRCELGGYAAGLLLMSLIKSLWMMRYKCNIRWVTDSKTAMSNVAKHANPEGPRRHKQPDNMDLLAIIRNKTIDMRRPIIPTWTKGHQTNKPENSTYSQNDIDANNRADELATWFREKSGMRQSIERTDHVEESLISVSINGIRVVSQMEECIRFHVNGYHLRRFIQRKHKWKDRTWNRIDLKTLGIFNRRLPPTQQIARTKFIFDQWNTGERRHQIANVKDPVLRLCPCCQDINENTDHVLQCQRNPGREKHLKSLKRKLSSSEPTPALILMKSGVIQWIENTYEKVDTDQFPSKFREGATRAMEDQAEIGWDAAIRGYWSVEWRQLAETGMADKEETSERRGSKTMQTVMKAVSDFTQDMWKTRNEILHNNQENVMKEIRQSEIAEIREIHGHPELVPAGDRHYCSQPLERLLKRAPATRRRWLRHMRAAKETMSTRPQSQILITNFFQSTRHIDQNG